MADIIAAYLIDSTGSILAVRMTVRGDYTQHQIDFAAQCAARSLGGTWRTMTKEEVTAYKLNRD